VRTLKLLLISAYVSSSVVLAQQDTIPNGNFEYWEMIPFLSEWQTNSCPPCMPQWDPYVVKQDSIDVYSGNYSVKLIFNGTPVSWGFAPAWAKVKFPIQNKPVSLHAYVKTEMYVPDPVKIEVLLYFNNNIVDNGFWQVDSAINNWTHIIIPISDNANNADSAQIILMGGVLATSTNFWVDNLSFNYTTSSEELLQERRINIFPNPTNRFLYFNIDNVQIEQIKIFDISGREIKNYSFELNTKPIIDLEEFANGAYYIKLQTTTGIYSFKIIKIP
jgi:hypothetical protein